MKKTLTIMTVLSLAGASQATAQENYNYDALRPADGGTMNITQETSYSEDSGVQTVFSLPQNEDAKVDNRTAIVKDGQGTLIIDSDLTMAHSFVVREGTVVIKGVDVLNNPPLESPNLTVGGKNARLIVDGGTYKQSIGSHGGNASAVCIGGRDGDGSLILLNGATTSTTTSVENAHGLFLGYPSNQTLMSGREFDTNAHVAGTYKTSNKADGLYRDPENFASDYEYGAGPVDTMYMSKGTLEVRSGSSYYAGTAIYAQNAEILIDGEGSRVIAGELVQGDPFDSQLGMGFGTDQGRYQPLTDIRVTNGGLLCFKNEVQMSLASGATTIQVAGQGSRLEMHSVVYNYAASAYHSHTSISLEDGAEAEIAYMLMGDMMRYGSGPEDERSLTIGERCTYTGGVIEQYPNSVTYNSGKMILKDVVLPFRLPGTDENGNAIWIESFGACLLLDAGSSFFNNPGATLEIEGVAPGLYVMPGATLRNDGLIRMISTGIELLIGGTLINNGTFTGPQKLILSGQDAKISGTGTVDVPYVAVVGGASVCAGEEETQSGQLTIQGDLELYSGTVVQTYGAGGSLNVNGRIGIKEAGVTVDGDLTVQAAPGLVIEPMDATASPSGCFTVDGTLTVNSTLLAREDSLSVIRDMSVSGTADILGTVDVGTISGTGTLTVGSADTQGFLISRGPLLEARTLKLTNATLTSRADAGTTVTAEVAEGADADFVGSWKLENLGTGARLQVGIGSLENQQGYLTLNSADEASIMLFGSGSTLSVTGASSISSVTAIGGSQAISLSGDSRVETLEVLDPDTTLTCTGPLTVQDLSLTGTDATGVELLVVGYVADITGGSKLSRLLVEADGVAQLRAQNSSLGEVTIGSGTVTLQDGQVQAELVSLAAGSATLDLAGYDLTAQAASAPVIEMQAGQLISADQYTGVVRVSGATDTLPMGGLTEQATLVLKTGGADDLQLTQLSGVTLGSGSEIFLTGRMQDLPEAEALLQFDQPAGSTVRTADGADVHVNINDVLTLVTVDSPASFTLANGADLSALNNKVTFDAAPVLFNMKAEFMGNGTVVLTQLSPTPDNIYISTEKQPDGSPEWVGHTSTGNVYHSTEDYVAVVIDQDTHIDLQDSSLPADCQGVGLAMPNLIGANGSTLIVDGDNANPDAVQRDLLTINPNIDPTVLPDPFANSLSFNGNIQLNAVDLQLAPTNAADPDQDSSETRYAIGGQLAADADSRVTVQSGTLQLVGDGNKLEGGLSVEADGQLHVSGDTALSGEVTGSLGSPVTPGKETDITVDAGKNLILAGAALDSIRISGESGSQLTVAAESTISTSADIRQLLLHIAEGATLTIGPSDPSQSSGTQASTALEYLGATGSGALVAEEGADARLTFDVGEGKAYAFEGSLAGYSGTIALKGDGSQTFTSDAPGTSFDVVGGNLILGSDVSRVKNLSLDGAGSVTLNLATQDATANSSLRVQHTLTLGSGTLNLTLNLTQGLVDGTEPAITAATVDCTGTGSIALTFADLGRGLDLSSRERVEAILVDAETLVGDGTVTLSTRDDKLMRKYFGDSAHIVVDAANADILLVGTPVTEDTADFHQQAASSHNGHTGAAMLDDLYSTLNPQASAPGSTAAAVLNQLESLIISGDSAAADRQMAAVSGASATVQGAAFAEDMHRQLRAIRNRTATMGARQTRAAGQGTLPFNAWINAEGNYRTMDQDGTLPGYKLDSWGGTVGLDADITPKCIAGLALTAMYGDLTAKAIETAKGDLDISYVTAFARYEPSAWVHTFVAAVGLADSSLDRTVFYEGGSYRTSGDTTGYGLGFMYELGYTIPMNEAGTTVLQPVANITYTHNRMGGYTETGSDLAVRYSDQRMDTLTLGVGLRAQAVVGQSVYNRSSLLEGRVLAKFDLGDRSSAADAAFASLAHAAGEVESAESGAVGMELGAGLSIPLGGGNSALFLDASLELRSDYTNANATVGYRMDF